MNAIIYKFTIKTSNRFYVGQYSGNKFNQYCGSGSMWRDVLKGLQKKYPSCWKQLVKREILWQGECNQKTLDKLEEIYIRREHANYSEKLGGCNILWGTANEFGSGSPSKDDLVKKKISKSRKGKHAAEEHHMFGKHWDEETKKQNSISNIGKQRGEKHWNYGKHWDEETRRKISESNKGRQSWLGLHHTEETKRKLSEHFTGKKWKDESKLKMKKTMTGKGNPMYGKIRINNGVVNSVISIGEIIPDGFVRGCLRRKKDE